MWCDSLFIIAPSNRKGCGKITHQDRFGMNDSAAYTDGTPIEIRDSVLIEHGRTPGTVQAVIMSVSEQKEWNVDEPGIMIESAPFGLVFIPVATFSDDQIILVEKNET
tara:strand:- start:463 stop:786 length:324 start_codon:yes stop_codon:yes gene_type:complete